MSRLLTVALLGSASAVLWSGSSLAQGYEPKCMAQVEKLCRGGDVSECFQDDKMWRKLDEACHGDVQTMIEMEREAGAQGGASAGDDAAIFVGYSYGGVLREGPGMEFRKIASLREGDRVEVLENTGISFDDYLWFRVRTKKGTGFHWGGIFCHEGGAVEGVFSKCK